MNMSCVNLQLCFWAMKPIVNVNLPSLLADFQIFSNITLIFNILNLNQNLKYKGYFIDNIQQLNTKNIFNKTKIKYFLFYSLSYFFYFIDYKLI